MCAKTQRSAPRAQRGLSLVEIMVGMVVGLIIGLAATGSAAVFTASQRQGIGAGGVAVNATTAMSAIKDEVASGGLGFFGNSRFLCYSLDLSVGSTVKFDAASFSPIRVTADGSNSQLDIFYSSSIDSGANVLMKGTSDSKSVMLNSLVPASVGQAVLLLPGAPDAARPCVVRSVTAVADATDTSPQTLTFANSGTYNKANFTTTPSYNESTNKDRVALLGDLRWTRLAISNGDLVMSRPLDGTSATLVRNVLAFRVQYGITGTGATDTTLTGWQDATGTDFASVSGATVDRVRAIRIGLVTRSPQPEKPNAGGACEATATMPQLFGTAVTSDKTDWQCWRYRSAQVVVPLRNLVW